MKHRKSKLKRRYGHAASDDAVAVVFRVWPKSEGGGVIALFPEDGQSYEHVGGHGSYDHGLVYRTRAATPAEYADLKRELESAPYHYKLRVMRRLQRRR
jgi:hypothetical protein